MFRFIDRVKIYFARRSAGPQKVYNKNGDVIYSRNLNEIEFWYDYDGKGNQIHCRDSTGFEYWKEYDENNALIKFQDSRGHIRFYGEKKNV